jgi:murein DD-endopeptidase MepM/ murein hydrolase activator NlpD
MLTFSGVFGAVATPVEAWSFSIKLEPRENALDNAGKAAAGRAAYQARYSAIMHPNTSLTRVRFSKHAAGGLVEKGADGAYAQADDEIGSAGTGPSSTLFPLQSALCISLNTNRPGARGKGRFFLPMPAMTLGPDYRLTEFGQTQVANASQAFLADIAAQVGDPVIASSFGFRSLVTSLRVGRVVDTLRSRRRDLDESYLERGVPA